MKQIKVLQILTNAIKIAEEQNVEIAVSIVDNGGHLIGFLRTEECSFAAIEVSKKKASTSNAFTMPTDLIGTIVQANPFMKEAFASFENIFYFGGGLPIIINGKKVGGIGISGVDPEQDKQIAEKAILELS
jgi:uncharacterized protein GlcG (DUF336 family)